ncbi:hypothetical protein IT407_02430 [Candidatus Uhrbacteria bacterium]|nr:hypothetical protein [Candidatus Uhrbacteria bacterium]
MQAKAASAVVFFELEAELHSARALLPEPLCGELQTAARACSLMYPFPMFAVGRGSAHACSISDCRKVFQKTVGYLTAQARPYYGTEDPEQQTRIEDMLWLRSKVLYALHAIH